MVDIYLDERPLKTFSITVKQNHKPIKLSEFIGSGIYKADLAPGTHLLTIIAHGSNGVSPTQTFPITVKAKQPAISVKRASDKAVENIEITFPAASNKIVGSAEVHLNHSIILQVHAEEPKVSISRTDLHAALKKHQQKTGKEPVSMIISARTCQSGGKLAGNTLPIIPDGLSKQSMKRHTTMSSRLLVLYFALLLSPALPAIAHATSASISVSGNEGAINVSADASFTEYPDSNAGSLTVYRNNSYLGSQAGNGSARWSTVINGGLLPQGAHTFSAIARDSRGDSDTATRTIIIDNTPAVTLTVADAEGDMEVHGTVDFKENITGAEGTVALYIQYDVYRSYWYHQGSKTYRRGNPH